MFKITDNYLIYIFQSSPYIKQNLAPTSYFYKCEVEITKPHNTINTVQGQWSIFQAISNFNTRVLRDRNLFKL